MRQIHRITSTLYADQPVKQANMYIWIDYKMIKEIMGTKQYRFHLQIMVNGETYASVQMIGRMKLIWITYVLTYRSQTASVTATFCRIRLIGVMKE